jgi:hypothetical protein
LGWGGICGLGFRWLGFVGSRRCFLRHSTNRFAALIIARTFSSTGSPTMHTTPEQARINLETTIAIQRAATTGKAIRLPLET